MSTANAHDEMKSRREEVESPQGSVHSEFFHEKGRRSSDAASQVEYEHEEPSLSRIQSRTTQMSRTTSRRSIPFGFTAGLGEENFDVASKVESQHIRNERAAAKGEDYDPNLVEWSGEDDPGNPMNWPEWKKWTITGAMSGATFVVTFTSTVFSTATLATAKEFGVSPEIMDLGTALVLVGYGFGPPLWGPVSELIGRKPPMIIGLLGLLIFTIPVAVAHDVQQILICRFFVGIFASGPISTVAGALSDFFGPIQRGLAMTLFVTMVSAGPIAGPIMGSFITQSHLGWRWTQWITIIMAGLFGMIAFLVVPESFAPVLLQRRAKKIRHETKNWAIHAALDEKQVNLKEFAVKYLLKPFKMFVLEPILALMTIYLTLIYGLVYLLFEALPISFGEQRGYNLGVSSLPFLSLLVGIIFGGLATTWITATRFTRIMRETGRLPPEERLIPMMIGAVLLPVGMFWFAWTSSPHISPWPSILALVPLGMGIQIVFQQVITYLVDCYLWEANSAVAANTVIRSLTAAGFVEFATGMYHRLGVAWASSLLGFLCLIMVPVPVLFYIYGERIRKMSRYSPFRAA